MTIPKILESDYLGLYPGWLSASYLAFLRKFLTLENEKTVVPMAKDVVKIK